MTLVAKLFPLVVVDENEWAASAIPESNEFCLTCFVVTLDVLLSELSGIKSLPSEDPGEVRGKVVLTSFKTFPSSPEFA